MPKRIERGALVNPNGFLRLEFGSLHERIATPMT
jgi:hypothetical protein